MAAKLLIHPAFYRQVRHYRHRIGVHDGRSRVAERFVKAAEEAVMRLLGNPESGRRAGFESSDLADILRVGLQGFAVFAVFYRWDGKTIQIITLEHTAQDLPSKLADVLSSY